MNGVEECLIVFGEVIAYLVYLVVVILGFVYTLDILDKIRRKMGKTTDADYNRYENYINLLLDTDWFTRIKDDEKYVRFTSITFDQFLDLYIKNPKNIRIITNDWDFYDEKRDNLPRDFKVVYDGDKEFLTFLVFNLEDFGKFVNFWNNKNTETARIKAHENKATFIKEVKMDIEEAKEEANEYFERSQKQMEEVKTLCLK